MRDFYRHERREDFFLEDLEKTAEPIVALEMPRRFHSIPDRNVILYLVLTILTAGIFGVYWLYSLIVDPNNHFNHQVAWENKLLFPLSKRTRA